MAYPRRLLANGERVELDLHPHVRVLFGPVLALLLVVPLAAYAAARIPEGDAQGPARVVVAVLALAVLVVTVLRPFLRWVTTHYVVTNRRLITRHGLVARSGRDVPLSRITDVSFSHGLVERVLGCGTLVVESAGERGQVVLADVPRVEAVQRRLHQLADDLEWAGG
ncbi:MAG TPA: PH domain-containing protein [Actinomycetales bacterium]|nr:PH domain-containing protein [Actinomycetales bacterium]